MRQIPKYQELFQRAKIVTERRKKQLEQKNINQAKQQMNYPFKPRLLKNRLKTDTVFLQRNSSWLQQNQRKKMLAQLTAQRQTQKKFKKSCVFNPEIHPVKHFQPCDIKGLDLHMQRQIKAKVKKQQQAFLSNHPYSHIWNSRVQFQSSFEELNLSLKKTPRHTRQPKSPNLTSRMLRDEHKQKIVIQKGVDQLMKQILKTDKISISRILTQQQ